MTETLQEFRDRMKRELSAAANEDLKAEVQRVQEINPGMSFSDAWNKVQREAPGFFRIGATVGNSSESHQGYLRVEARAQNLMYQSGGTMTLSEALRRVREGVVEGSDNPGNPMDPRYAREMAAHKKIHDNRASDDMDVAVQRMARIRRMMTEKNMTFDAAFSAVCQEENEAKKAQMETPATTKAEATTGQTFLVSAIESDRELDVGSDE